MAQARLTGERARMKKILRVLHRLYPESSCSLAHETPFQLLISTILSAQCTDERVNLVTPALFQEFPDAASMAEAKLADLENLIRSTGFYSNKAKSLSETSKLLMERHRGEVPKSIEELVSLRGVGRKTANVVLGNAFGVPGLVVDTHVGRISRRLGFTPEIDPVKVEIEMMEIVPKAEWVVYSHLLIDHGRAVCKARTPLCGECALFPLCPKIGVPKSA